MVKVVLLLEWRMLRASAQISIYVIDRLGRYVSGFPIELGKEITLGPDVYDFSGARKYNIMVLHEDNTIQMYNLKGKKPESWKLR